MDVLAESYSMRNGLVLSFVALMVPTALAQIQWAPNQAAAEAEAAATGKLIMIDFYTDWCGWCKKLDKTTYRDPLVAQLSRQFVPLKLDAERDGKKLAGNLGVRAYPTISFVDASGEERHRNPGYLPPDQFAQMLKSVAPRAGDLLGAKKAVATNPNDAAAQARLALALAVTGDADEADAALKKALAANATDPAVGQAANTLGDHYQAAGKTDQALAAYAIAADTAREPAVRAHALLGQMRVHSAKGESEKATSAARELAALQGAPAYYLEQAKKSATP